MTTYESQFLALCQQHEGLRRACGHRWWPLDPQQPPCPLNCVCGGRNWLPLPEAERLGALVRVAGSISFELDWAGRWTVDNDEATEAVTPEAALTAALTEAQ